MPFGFVCWVQSSGTHSPSSVTREEMASKLLDKCHYRIQLPSTTMKTAAAWTSDRLAYFQQLLDTAQYELFDFELSARQIETLQLLLLEHKKTKSIPATSAWVDDADSEEDDDGGMWV
ncbi:Aste57867_9983 [Aphanomyces stellatus]|uniref:Aste57867_9983 protein n=1 Tax=Aphanomyces stellatus TaxID=120398 RepID=A0A485KPJ7_9STRA|nr:hypothetical protein As57867_009944 [Aphanomyces stellatus]VFT86861.1 Aste57867_9983 [Aphanomyces stellatus]